MKGWGQGAKGSGAKGKGKAPGPDHGYYPSYYAPWYYGPVGGGQPTQPQGQAKQRTQRPGRMDKIEAKLDAFIGNYTGAYMPPPGQAAVPPIAAAAEPSPASSWICQECQTTHDNMKKKQCRHCKALRIPAEVPATARQVKTTQPICLGNRYQKLMNNVGMTDECKALQATAAPTAEQPPLVSASPAALLQKVDVEMAPANLPTPAESAAGQITKDQFDAKLAALAALGLPPAAAKDAELALKKQYPNLAPAKPTAPLRTSAEAKLLRAHQLEQREAQELTEEAEAQELHDRVAAIQEEQQTMLARHEMQKTQHETTIAHLERAEALATAQEGPAAAAASPSTPAQDLEREARAARWAEWVNAQQVPEEFAEFVPKPPTLAAPAPDAAPEATALQQQQLQAQQQQQQQQL
jgi:hypothetical protein